MTGTLGRFTLSQIYFGAWLAAALLFSVGVWWLWFVVPPGPHSYPQVFLGIPLFGLSVTAWGATTVQWGRLKSRALIRWIGYVLVLAGIGLTLLIPSQIIL